MLTIRKTQMSELRRTTGDEYVARLGRHLRRHFPGAVEGMADAYLHQFVEHHWQAALQFGLLSELAGCTYLEAVCSFGENFPAKQAWAAVLADLSASERQKILTLNDRMLAQRDAQIP